MEILDIVDDNGIPTGKTVERKTAHREGIQHRTAHLWIARKKGGNIELLLQKRCMEKDSFPGCYDISSAGHIPAGMDYVPSALRELREELGVTAKEEDLIFCGKKRVTVTSEFHEHPYTDRQVCNVYLMWLDREAEDFVVQKEERAYHTNGRHLCLPICHTQLEGGDDAHPTCSAYSGLYLPGYRIGPSSDT